MATPVFGDMSDRLLVATPLMTVAVAAESWVQGWDLCHDIIARLRVTDAAAGAGDSLIVLIQHSLDHVVWTTLITFTTVLGNGSMPATETKSVGKGAALVAWGPWLRVLATPAGGTAVFTIGDVRIIGS